LSGSLPFGMICAALFLHSALDWARNRGPLAWRAAWFATLLVLATQSGIAWSRIQAHDRLRADYRATAQYLLATGNPSHISVYPHPFRLYLGEDRTAIPPSSEEELRELYEKGFRFVVLVEFMEYYVDRFDVPELTSRIPAIRSLPESRTLLEKIRKALKPEYEAACDFCVSPLNIFEINLNYKKSLAFIEESSQNRYGTIKVYDLGKYFPSENPGGESGSWEGEFPGKRTTVKASF